MEAMPSATLKPEDEAVQLDETRLYRTTYMFSATMPPAVERLARKCVAALLSTLAAHTASVYTLAHCMLACALRAPGTCAALWS